MLCCYITDSVICRSNPEEEGMRSGCIEREKSSLCIAAFSNCMDTHINKPDSLWWCVKSIERVLNLNKKENKIILTSSGNSL